MSFLAPRKGEKLKSLRLVIKPLLAIELTVLFGCSGRNGYQLAGFKRQEDGTIAFDIRKGSQRMKAACKASGNQEDECSQLTLKVGNSVDCYIHAGSKQNPFETKTDAYSETGVVCHAGQGRGQIFGINPASNPQKSMIPIPANAATLSKRMPSVRGMSGRTLTSQ